jgi:hypothetical protein
MATTTGTAVFYDKAKGKIVGGTIDLDTPDVRILLVTSSYTPSVTAHDYLNDVTTYEVTTNGASRYALVSEAKTEPVAGTWMFDSANPSWTASGGSIVARYWIMYNYNASDASAELICYGLLDNTNADVTTTVGNTLTITVNTDGWFRWT